MILTPWCNDNQVVKDQKTHVQAKNTQQSIHNCATGMKAVIITPGNFKVIADKKNGKWHVTISIEGLTEKIAEA